MNDLDLPYSVVPMELEDILQVSLVDRLSFTTPWSVSAYRYEIAENEAAYYFVVIPYDSQKDAEVDGRWIGRLRRRFKNSISDRFIIGYGGFWLLVDEAHISTIAIRPEYRRRGLGELLLLKMIEEAIALRAERVTLEVRKSNYNAQQLYYKYGFEVTGRRLAYYTDDREDALIMTVENVLTLTYHEKLTSLKDDLYHRLENQVAPNPIKTD
jgi:[ribosomal protein S18]-alanine N-acetyltransferase